MTNTLNGTNLKKTLAWLNETKSGCSRYYVGNSRVGELYVVFGWVEDGIRGKVARNADDLQCDYDYDWEMPCSEDGTVDDTDTEIPECTTDKDYEDLANEWIATAKRVLTDWN